MKCCECGKEVDVSKTGIPPMWYGKYEGDKFVDLICAACIATPEGKEKWRAPKIDKVENSR
jgi:hypothetical protein